MKELPIRYSICLDLDCSGLEDFFEKCSKTLDVLRKDCCALTSVMFFDPNSWN